MRTNVIKTDAYHDEKVFRSIHESVLSTLIGNPQIKKIDVSHTILKTV